MILEKQFAISSNNSPSTILSTGVIAVNSSEDIIVTCYPLHKSCHMSFLMSMLSSLELEKCPPYVRKTTAYLYCAQMFLHSPFV